MVEATAIGHTVAVLTAVEDTAVAAGHIAVAARTEAAVHTAVAERIAVVGHTAAAGDTVVGHTAAAGRIGAARLAGHTAFQ